MFSKLNNGFPLQNNASPVVILSSVARTFGQDYRLFNPILHQLHPLQIKIFFVTQWRRDNNFLRLEKYFAHSLFLFMKYCFQREKLKFTDS